MIKIWKYTLISVFMILSLLILSAVFPNITWLFATSEEAMSKFYSQENVAEDMLIDPLILCGEKVLPLVIKSINNKEMPKRRYAISFLGNGHFKEALPALLNILSDSLEYDYFRGDALEAIFQIDSSLGKKLARNYLVQNNNLGKMSTWIIENQEWLFDERTFMEALSGHHE